MKEHGYNINLTWTGNRGEGTKSYASYDRSYDIVVDGKPVLSGSSDPSFRGDPQKFNPEEMLLMALSSCHMLWYLHLCSANGIMVESYKDIAVGVMIENSDGSGEFSEVTLNLEIAISSGDIEKAEKLHHEANQKCFIARSVNFPVNHSVKVIIQP